MPPLLPTTIDAAVRRRVASSGDNPFLTFYDDATGERVELGHATFENWTAKTANLLQEEFAVGPGDVVRVHVGSHWTTAAIVFACWRLGAVVALGIAGERAACTVVEEGAAEGAGGGARLVVGSGMGGRLADPAERGALGYGEEILAYPDDVDGPEVTPDTPALLAQGTDGRAVRLTQRNLLAAADALTGWGLGADGRLLVTQSTRTVEGLVLGLLGPYTAGGSVVLVRTADLAGIWRRVRAERVTAALLPGEGLDPVPAPGQPHGLRAVLCPGGAPLDALRRAGARLGVPVCVGHGLVEATCASSLVPAGAGSEVHAWLAGTAAPTVGAATSRAEVAILGPDGTETAEGERGEVCVRGDVVTPDAGPWLHTGDEGFAQIGPDGRAYVFLTGRSGEGVPIGRIVRRRRGGTGR